MTQPLIEVGKKPRANVFTARVQPACFFAWLNNHCQPVTDIEWFVRGVLAKTLATRSSQYFL